jgi:hypothetical protein
MPEAMIYDRRDFFTGVAMIALAIEASKEWRSSEMRALVRAVKELSPHGSGPELTRAEQRAEQQSRYAMAQQAVIMADAIIRELDETDPDDRED